MSKQPIPIKLVIVGDGGVGKSSITMSLLKRGFSDDWDPTIEDFYSTNLVIDGQEYAVEICDTAGQEEYRGMWGEATVREGDGFILTYAIDSKSSFELIPEFMHTIRKVKSPDEHPTTANTPENTPFPFLIVGNKCDLPPTSRKVFAQTALAFSRSAGGLFFECSAKMRVNIDASFESIVRATARSKLAHIEYLRRHGGNDEDFNGNVSILERGGGVAPRGKGGEGGWEEDDEVIAEKNAKRKKNPKLEMNRRNSMSHGGLGRHPDRLNDDEGGGCCCIVS